MFLKEIQHGNRTKSEAAGGQGPDLKGGIALQFWHKGNALALLTRVDTPRNP